MDPGQPMVSWSTRTLKPSRQFDGFREAVSETHLPWDLPKRREPAFTGDIRQQGFAGGRVIECTCEPCDGRRGRFEISRSDQACYGVLYVLRGRELVRQGGRETFLGAGDFALWDSTRAIDFAIGAELHKITLLVPQALLDAVLPQAPDLVATAISSRKGRGALFASHLRMLARERRHLAAATVPSLFSATLDLLAASLQPEESAVRVTASTRLRSRIEEYIESHLADPSLAPVSIAQAHGISVRQLHRVFADTEFTVERWIWSRRLESCRRDLLQQPNASISQIAFAWGFNDAAHFSRAFRERFGVSPRGLRKMALGGKRE
jgi:AraC-like DNA-binding protein